MHSIVIDRRIASVKAATAVAGSLGYPSKMPGTAYGLPAQACHVGGKLAEIEGSVCAKCYALKGNYILRDVQTSQATRLASIIDPDWTDAMVLLLDNAHARGTGKNGPIASGWHRWHDSGDLQSIDHLAKICDVACRTPHIRHWLPTREMGIVAKYRAQGGIIPDNLTVRVSATMIDGPATKAWPTTSGVHDEVAPSTGTHICPAPTQDGICGDCRACWSREVPHVSYHKH